eukprot:TRINITY_DN639_c0_g1_i1.p2 TRINITY_DN639_c0_g1~~TRINITY_DN639_c0_g1_i1.p2  ORF type:complete len:325 (-),score=31.79 TRINITY_DN639_c0_g1_i1:375-1349(-)
MPTVPVSAVARRSSLTHNVRWLRTPRLLLGSVGDPINGQRTAAAFLSICQEKSTGLQRAALHALVADYTGRVPTLQQLALASLLKSLLTSISLPSDHLFTDMLFVSDVAVRLRLSSGIEVASFLAQTDAPLARWLQQKTFSLPFTNLRCESSFNLLWAIETGRGRLSADSVRSLQAFKENVVLHAREDRLNGDPLRLSKVGAKNEAEHFAAYVTDVYGNRELRPGELLPQRRACLRLACAVSSNFARSVKSKTTSSHGPVENEHSRIFLRSMLPLPRSSHPCHWNATRSVRASPRSTIWTTLRKRPCRVGCVRRGWLFPATNPS